MKATLSTITAILIAAVLAAPAAEAQQRGNAANGTCGQVLTTYFDQLQSMPLSSAEIAAVADLREEEKLARDVYLTLAERWQLPVFTNIARAEQQHMDHMVLLLVEYQIPDPVVDDTVGVFQSVEYAQLYVDLTARGQVSLVDALDVGATIEDLDLADIEDLLALTDNDHIGLIAHNLAKGSRNHLRAFVGALAAQGQTYTAQYLDQSTVDQIVASPRERGTIYDENGDVLALCGGSGGGRGGRRGGSGGGPGGGQGGGTGPGSGTCDGTGPGGN